MTETKLVIGNKNYSSWSLRGWLMAKRAGLDFEEILIPLDQDGFKQAILSHSPAGRVPILKHDGMTIWDSLAIGEYLAEIAPDAGLWPTDASARAEARCIASEMHSGFEAVRTHMPMDLRNHWPARGDGPGVDDDIQRIIDIWSTCLGGATADQPFLFGGFCMADAMFAPVVGRFRTYGVSLPASCQTYADAVWHWPDMRKWLAAAEAEPWVIEAPKT